MKLSTMTELIAINHNTKNLNRNFRNLKKNLTTPETNMSMRMISSNTEKLKSRQRICQIGKQSSKRDMKSKNKAKMRWAGSSKTSTKWKNKQMTLEFNSTDKSNNLTAFMIT